MRAVSQVKIALKALHQLGPRVVGAYARYQIGLRTGYYRWKTPNRSGNGIENHLQEDHSGLFLERGIFTVPEVSTIQSILGDKGKRKLLQEADEITAGKVRLFGRNVLTQLSLETDHPPSHWTDYELGRSVPNWGDSDLHDIKLVWEPGRFGWAYTLVRAYVITNDDRYPAAFWEHAETFLGHNPSYLGPHWMSAQEVALRLIALVFAGQVFAPADSSTDQRMVELAYHIRDHALRIPPTLTYARAQNNNHLLVEALGLFTAGLAIPGHPKAGEWRDQGWYWIEYSLQDQIAPDGSYIQQSTNYHRLMLQAALWANCLAKSQGRKYSLETRERLKAATLWLLALVDTVNGKVPNLGPNDGAYIFPLAICPFDDFRPTLQAAARAFLSGGPFPAGVWDEMASWFAIPDQPVNTIELERSNEQIGPKVIIRPAGSESWGYLRVANFTARPGHADQLHLDLWWRGQNVVRDPGTYLYNAQPPWRNALARSSVHNVIIIDQQDQMTAAGRFLWLDWAQAEVVEKIYGDNGALVEVTAQHDGYRRLGIEHRRTVSAHSAGKWHVVDEILYKNNAHANSDSLTTHTVCLRWQLPDWEWLIVTDSPDNYCLVLKSPNDKFQLKLYLELKGERTPIPGKLTLARAGKSVYGSGMPSPEEGWYSSTYAEKAPALTLGLTATRQLPLRIHSQFVFPEKE
jgi:hypothetical protein